MAREALLLCGCYSNKATRGDTRAERLCKIELGAERVERVNNKKDVDSLGRSMCPDGGSLGSF